MPETPGASQAPTAWIDFPAHVDGPATERQQWRFDTPQQWLVAHDPAQVARLLDDVHALAQQGKWCVGWVAYEAAPAFDPSLPVKALPPGAPYAAWAVFDASQVHPASPNPAPISPDMPNPTWSLGPWQACRDEAQIGTQVEHIRELIRQGEVYQVNLTDRLQAPLGVPGQPDQAPDTAGLHACFEALRLSQPLGYCAFIDARAACRGPGAVLSVSPELFFDWDGHTLTTRPMKGTAARTTDPQTDQAAADHLRSSPKERAENLMIVDLLRNDVSKVAQVGSVHVPSLFDVQALPTVWQMTSTIQARSREHLRLSEVFAALFPCGSVTGAPKQRAMHHIARLESGPRAVYCGAVGIMRPGGHVTFNVPIRTVSVHTPPPPAPWTAHCGIGSGITLDATPYGEWQEWAHKQQFLQRAREPFDLLESLRLEQGQVLRWARHLQRLQASAQHFGRPCPLDALERALTEIGQAHPEGVHKVRLLLSASGAVRAEASELHPPTGPLTVVLAASAMPPADDFIRHKTTLRAAYDAHRPPAGRFDTLLFNHADQLTEFTIGNLALQLDGQWFTPPLDVGLLPGVMRATLLAEGVLQEKVLHRSDLPQATGMALINSVRGWLPVQLTPR